MKFHFLHIKGHALFHSCCCARTLTKSNLRRGGAVFHLTIQDYNSSFGESQGRNLQELVTFPVESGESVHGCLLLKLVACHCSSGPSHEVVLPTFRPTFPLHLREISHRCAHRPSLSSPGGFRLCQVNS